MRKEIVTPGPRFCWECSRLLRQDSAGNLLFKTVRGEDGTMHRVHKACDDGPAIMEEGQLKTLVEHGGRDPATRFHK